MEGEDREVCNSTLENGNRHVVGMVRKRSMDVDRHTAEHGTPSLRRAPTQRHIPLRMDREMRHISPGNWYSQSSIESIVSAAIITKGVGTGRSRQVSEHW